MTFEFDFDDFLTDRNSELESAVYAEHPDLFMNARRVNYDCHEILFSANIHNRDLQEIITATLFMRALEHYQATVILLARGTIAAARVTLRALVETTFKIRAVAASSDGLNAFISEDPVHRLKLINKARSNSYQDLEEARLAISEDDIKELKQEIKKREAKALSTEEWSRLSGMHSWYVTNYALLSKAVHTQARELESYLKLRESDEIQQLRYAPSMDEIPPLILTATHCLLIGASAFDQTFKMGFGSKGDEHSKLVEAGFRSLDEEDTE